MEREHVRIQDPEHAQQHGSEQTEQIRHGDREAFKELFHAQYEALCRYAYRHVGALEVAEDLVQNVFFDLWKRRATWDPRHSPRAFLYGAVRNQIRKHHRRSSIRNHVTGADVVDDLPAQEDPEAALHDRDLHRMKDQALDALPLRCRHVFMLSREHGLTYAEIAAVLSISIKTVETHMGRALQLLRGRFSSLR